MEGLYVLNILYNSFPPFGGNIFRMSVRCLVFIYKNTLLQSLFSPFTDLSQIHYNTIDCSWPGSSVHRNLQARIPEWVAVSFPSGSFLLRDQTWVSCTSGRFHPEPLGKPSNLTRSENVELFTILSYISTYGS